MGEGKEGDTILLQALKSVKCVIPDSVTSIVDITPEILVSIVSRCVYLISNGDIECNSELSTNIAARHRLCTDIANKVKALGCTVDCGYNQLLYPVEVQTRRLLNWLVTKLPRVDEDTPENYTTDELFKKKIKDSLKSWMNEKWKLPYTTIGVPARNIYKRKASQTADEILLDKKDIHNIYKWSARTTLTSSSSSNKIKISPATSIIEMHVQELLEEEKYEKYDDALLLSSLNDEQRLADANKKNDNNRKTIANAVQNSMNGSGTSVQLREMSKMSFDELLKTMSDKNGVSDTPGKKSRFEQSIEFAEEKSNNNFKDINLSTTQEGSQETADERRLRKEQELQNSRREELQFFKDKLDTEMAKLQQLQIDEQEAIQREEKAKTGLDDLLEEIKKLQKETNMKQQTLDMLPKAAENLAKLKAICEASQQRLHALEAEWSKFKEPLQAQLDNARNINKARRSEVQELVDKMRALRDEMPHMLQELKDKQQLAAQLAEELQSLPNINRNEYTNRIMDIIKQIAQQDKNIAQITGEIRDLQRQIKNTTESVERADAIAEEKIYGTAKIKSNEASVEVYKALMTLRSSFEALIRVVNDIGLQKKLTSELENKIEQESARVSSQNFDRIRSDLDKIRAENKTLLQKLSKKANQSS